MSEGAATLKYMTLFKSRITIFVHLFVPYRASFSTNDLLVLLRTRDSYLISRETCSRVLIDDPPFSFYVRMDGGGGS